MASLIDELDDLEVSTRLLNCLRNAGCRSLKDAANWTRARWRREPNLGERTVRELGNILEEYGLSFATETPAGEPPDIERPLYDGLSARIDGLSKMVSKLRHEVDLILKEYHDRDVRDEHVDFRHGINRYGL